MQHFFLFLFVLSNISLASESSNGDGLYEFGNLDDPLSDVSDCNSAFDSWDVPNDDTSNQNENTNLDMFSQSNAGDTNTDLIAAGCPPTDGLGARDQTLCPNNQIITPELPTLDTLEKLAPSASPDEKTDTSEETHPVGTGENGICPPLRPINLCCICEAQFQFTYCQDCLPMASVGGVCYSPHIEVCCGQYGLRVVNSDTGLTNLDWWVRGWYEFNVNLDLNMQEGSIAESCSEIAN